jgi:hypothetical protein
MAWRKLRNEGLHWVHIWNISSDDQINKDDLSGIRKEKKKGM